MKNGKKAFIFALIVTALQVLTVFALVPFAEHSVLTDKIEMECSSFDSQVRGVFNYGGWYSFDFENRQPFLCPVIKSAFQSVYPGYGYGFFMSPVFFIVSLILALIFLNIKSRLGPRKYLLIRNYLAIILAVIIVIGLVDFFTNDPCSNVEDNQRNSCLNVVAYLSIVPDNNFEYSEIRKIGEDPRYCLNNFENKSFEQRKCFMQIAHNSSCWLGDSPTVGGEHNVDSVSCVELQEISPIDLKAKVNKKEVYNPLANQ